MASGPEGTRSVPRQEGAETLPQAGDDRIQELLLKTSRTFALVIPQLPQPTCREVSLAYLLFRVADTLEDAGARWERARQLEALSQLDGLLRSFSAAQARRCS